VATLERAKRTRGKRCESARLAQRVGFRCPRQRFLAVQKPLPHGEAQAAIVEGEWAPATFEEIAGAKARAVVVGRAREK